jgi:hypothetical protein
MMTVAKEDVRLMTMLSHRSVAAWLLLISPSSLGYREMIGFHLLLHG